MGWPVAGSGVGTAADGEFSCTWGAGGGPGAPKGSAAGRKRIGSRSVLATEAVALVTS